MRVELAREWDVDRDGMSGLNGKGDRCKKNTKPARNDLR
jgi:hypothetical protein